MRAIRRQFCCTRRPPSSRRRATLEPLETRRLLSGEVGATAQLLQAYGRLPLSFEANQGQTDASVQFLSRGAGSTLFLDPTEAVLSLQGSAPGSGDVVRVQLQGADPAVRGAGRDPLPTTTNYLIGDDPARSGTPASPLTARSSIRTFIRGSTWSTTATSKTWSTTSSLRPESAPGSFAWPLRGPRR